MTENPLRVAFFPDAFHEVDGVAQVARQFERFARQNDLPFLMVHAGAAEEVVRDGSVTRIQLPRGPIKFPLDRAHDFDLLFLRHYRKLAPVLREFRPDIIQITGPRDIGILGAILAHKLKVPLSAFWQTNLPEYAGLRAAQAVSFLPAVPRRYFSAVVERLSSLATTRFYKIPGLVFAPNQEIAKTLANATGKPCLPMAHGVDPEVFRPDLRDAETGLFTIGYVGRLSAEKSVRDLARLEKSLKEKGHTNFRIVIVGQGTEEAWLRKNLQNGVFLGVLHGPELARAYANMDVFAFPSRTYTFGLVVLEALASGVPTVVTASGGPKYIVRHGDTGFAASNYNAFVCAVTDLMTRPELLLRMRTQARRQALACTWSKAFTDIYEAYANHLKVAPVITQGLLSAVIMQP